MIVVQCPQCGKQLNIDDKFAGQTGQCNGCGAPIQVPARPVFDEAPRAEVLKSGKKALGVSVRNPVAHGARFGLMLLALVVFVVLPIAAIVFFGIFGAGVDVGNEIDNASSVDAGSTTTSPDAYIMQPFQSEYFSIMISGAEVNHPKVDDIFDQAQTGDSPQLIVYFQIKNTHRERAVRYLHDAFNRNVTMWDDMNNQIPGVSYDGVKTLQVLHPRATGKHPEIFMVPPPSAKYVDVLIDLALFSDSALLGDDLALLGEKEEVRIRIPTDQIVGFQ